MTRQQFGLVLGDLRKLVFEGLGDPGVKRMSPFAQQRAVGGILYQSMLKQVGRMRWHALAKQQTGHNEAVESRFQLVLGCAYHCSQNRMGKLTTDGGTHLCHLLRGAEAV